MSFLMESPENHHSEQEHEHEYSHHEQQQQQQQQHQGEEHRDLIEQKASFAELVVRAATICNKLILENCSICTLYCDKQVQYETTTTATTMMERYVSGTTTGNYNGLSDLFRRLDDADPTGVNDAFRLVFDEQSVVQSVRSRLQD